MCTNMARPKAEDPTVPVTFRIRKSRWAWWVAEGARVNHAPHKLVAAAVEAKAEKEMARTVQANDEVTPRFGNKIKKDGKKDG